MLDVNFKAVKVPKIAAWPLLSRLQFLRPVMRPASLDNRSLAQKTQNPKQPRKTFIKNLIAEKKKSELLNRYTNNMNLYQVAKKYENTVEQSNIYKGSFFAKIING